MAEIPTFVAEQNETETNLIICNFNMKGGKP